MWQYRLANLLRTFSQGTVVISIILLLIGGFILYLTVDFPVKGSSNEYSSDMDQRVIQADTFIKDNLKDPENVEFLAFEKYLEDGEQYQLRTFNGDVEIRSGFLLNGKWYSYMVFMRQASDSADWELIDYSVEEIN